MKKVDRELFPGYLVRKDWCNDFVDYFVSPNLLLNRLPDKLSDLDFLIYFFNSFQKLEVIDLRLSDIKNGKPFEEKLKYENLNLLRWMAILQYKIQHKEINADTDSVAHINNSSRAFYVNLDELIGKELIKKEEDKKMDPWDAHLNLCMFKITDFLEYFVGPGAKPGRLTNVSIVFQTEEEWDELLISSREAEIIWPKEYVHPDLFFITPRYVSLKDCKTWVSRIMYEGESLRLFYWPYGDTPRYIIAPPDLDGWLGWEYFFYPINFSGYGYNLNMGDKLKLYQECFFSNYEGSYEKAAKEMHCITEQMYDIWKKGEKSTYYGRKGEDPYSWFSYKYPYKPYDIKKLWKL
jgi:hypothetical protein